MNQEDGTSLVVQWLRLCFLPLQGAWIQSLVRELRSPMPRQGQKNPRQTKNKPENHQLEQAGNFEQLRFRIQPEVPPRSKFIFSRPRGKKRNAVECDRLPWYRPAHSPQLALHSLLSISNEKSFW